MRPQKELTLDIIHIVEKRIARKLLIEEKELLDVFVEKLYMSPKPFLHESRKPLH